MGKLTTMIYLVGAYKVGMPLYDYANYRYNVNRKEQKDVLRNEYRIKENYNSSDKPQWAVVTGASEGIGRCFALDLARCGFNIVLASRSIEKLEKVQNEISAIN